MHLLKVRFDFLCYVSVLASIVISRPMPVPKPITIKAGDDVEVGVEDDLAGDGVVVHFYVDAVGT